MTNTIIGLRDLCLPAWTYLVISCIFLTNVYYRKSNNIDVFGLNTYKHGTETTNIFFILSVLYNLVWTWILNIICNYGFVNIAWLFVFIPYLIYMIMFALYIS
jgi:hypothetical protein